MTEPTTSPQGFHRNEYYERLKRLRVEDPRAFAVLSPAEKLSLAAYERARETVEPQSPVEPQPTHGSEEERKL